MAEMLVRYAGVNPKDITGMRAPFLAVGGDTMFRMLNRYGLMYDSSMSVPNPSWPYTLNYKIPHTCAVKPCPTESHPGKLYIFYSLGVPFLAVGGDTMLRMLNHYGLMYDSSMLVPNPSWPYILN